MKLVFNSLRPQQLQHNTIVHICNDNNKPLCNLEMQGYIYYILFFTNLSYNICSKCLTKFNKNESTKKSRLPKR